MIVGESNEWILVGYSESLELAARLGPFHDYVADYGPWGADLAELYQFKKS